MEKSSLSELKDVQEDENEIVEESYTPDTQPEKKGFMKGIFNKKRRIGRPPAPRVGDIKLKLKASAPYKKIMKLFFSNWAKAQQMTELNIEGDQLEEFTLAWENLILLHMPKTDARMGVYINVLYQSAAVLFVRLKLIQERNKQNAEVSNETK